MVGLDKKFCSCGKPVPLVLGSVARKRGGSIHTSTHTDCVVSNENRVLDSRRGRQKTRQEQ